MVHFFLWIPAGVDPVLVGATLCGDSHRGTGGNKSLPCIACVAIHQLFAPIPMERATSSLRSVILSFDFKALIPICNPW